MFNHFCLLWLQLFQKKLLVRKGGITSDKSEVANSFYNFFENAIYSVGIKTREYSHESYCLKSPVLFTINRFEQKILLTKILLTMKVFIFYRT